MFLIAARRALAAVVVAVPLAAAVARFGPGATHAVLTPAPAADVHATAPKGLATAVFAGGCFWGVEAVFEHVRGVTDVVSGFAGGMKATATYDQVSDGDTGHAEAVRVTYDPAVVSYADLLRVFFSVAHDPTQLNYQGPDHGTQYRSAIFYTDEAQHRAAQAYVAQLTAAHTFRKPIVTEVSPLKGFYPAEAYHQDFAERNPTYPYIVINDRPKVEALKKLLPQLYHERAVASR